VSGSGRDLILGSIQESPLGGLLLLLLSLLLLSSSSSSLLLLTAIELSLGGSSAYTSTDKTNKNKYT
jgi:hypothetical protein